VKSARTSGAPQGGAAGSGNGNPNGNPPESRRPRVVAFASNLGAFRVGATGFEPATTCTPTGTGGLAPRLTETDGALPRGIPGNEYRPNSDAEASEPTIRIASTAPALRSSGLPAPEPVLFVTAGRTVARLWSTQEIVVLARAALQAALADAALVARGESAAPASAAVLFVAGYHTHGP
jgi:hypothetical protein